MRGIEKVIDVLLEAGIDTIYGIPGGAAMGFYNALYDKREKFKIILTRTEQGASIMAQTHGRITRNPAVFVAQGAFAGSTGLFGIMEAFLASTPMIIITDISEYGSFPLQGPLHCGSGEYGGFDLWNIFKSTTKFATMAAGPEQLVQGIQLAIKHSLSGRPGPAACIMRGPAIITPIKEGAIPPLYETQGYLNATKPAAPQKDIEEIIDMLSRARSPVIIAGNGVRIANAAQDLILLAESMAIPVATSNLGKSCIPELHPLALGCIAPSGQHLAFRMVNEADLLLVIGCRLKPNDAWFFNPAFIDPRRQKIIQIDIDPRNFGWAYPVSKGITGDAKEVLKQMLARARDKLALKDPEEKKKKIQSLLDSKKKEGFFENQFLYSDQIPVLPQRLVKELRESLDENTVVVTDGGNNRHWMLQYFPVKSIDSYFNSGGIGGVGYSIPAVIAAQRLRADKNCIAVCGDSGFSQQMVELFTAIQYGISPLVVVMNDSALGMVKEIQKDRCIASEYIDIDFAQVAQSMGCIGIRIERPQDLRPAFERAKNREKPVVIDVVIDRREKVMDRTYDPMAKRVMEDLRRGYSTFIDKK